MSSLESLLSLFGLTIPFSKDDLKHAKRKVNMLHPDKHYNNADIKLEYDKYLRAYNKIKTIYSYTNNETSEEKFVKIDIDNTFKNHIEKNGIKEKEFLIEFNDMFDKVHVKTDEELNGYDKWLKSNDDLYDKDNIDKSRKILIQHNSLIKQPDLIEGNAFGSYFCDLKDAHVNTIIGLDEEKVFSEKKKFKSVHEYDSYRNNDCNVSDPKYRDSDKTHFQDEYKKNTHASLKLAYQYKNIQEQMEENMKIYSAKFNRLK